MHLTHTHLPLHFQATGFLLTKRACFTGRFSLFKGLVHVTVRRWTSKLQLLGLRPSPWKQLWLKPNIQFRNWGIGDCTYQSYQVF